MDKWEARVWGFLVGGAVAIGLVVFPCLLFRDTSPPPSRIDLLERRMTRIEQRMLTTEHWRYDHALMHSRATSPSITTNEPGVSSAIRIPMGSIPEGYSGPTGQGDVTAHGPKETTERADTR